MEFGIIIIKSFFISIFWFLDYCGFLDLQEVAPGYWPHPGYYLSVNLSLAWRTWKAADLSWNLWRTSMRFAIHAYFVIDIIFNHICEQSVWLFWVVIQLFGYIFEFEYTTKLQLSWCNFHVTHHVTFLCL